MVTGAGPQWPPLYQEIQRHARRHPGLRAVLCAGMPASTELSAARGYARVLAMANGLRFHGCMPANLLPFTADLAIDEPAYRRHLRWLAGRARRHRDRGQRPRRPISSLTREERRRTLAIALDEVAGKVPSSPACTATARSRRWSWRAMRGRRGRPAYSSSRRPCSCGARSKSRRWCCVTSRPSRTRWTCR